MDDSQSGGLDFITLYGVWQWGIWNLFIYLSFILTFKIWQGMNHEILPPPILLSPVAIRIKNTHNFCISNFLLDQKL